MDFYAHNKLAVYKLALAIFVSLFSVSLAHATCQPTLQQQVEIQIQKHGSDPAKVVEDLTRQMHPFLRSHANRTVNSIFTNEDSVQRQMSLLFNHFSMSTWISRLSMIPKMQSADAFKNSELNYLFSNWVRVKYLLTVHRLVASRELKQVFKEKDRFPASIREQAINNPANLVVTGYSSYNCQNKIDNYAYDCSKKMVFVHTHLSPKILCKNAQLARHAKFKYLVQKQGDTFRVIDIEANGKRVYRDSFDDFKSLIQTVGADELSSQLKIWSFLKQSKTSEQAVRSFQKNIPSQPSRLPASK